MDSSKASGTANAKKQGLSMRTLCVILVPTLISFLIFAYTQQLPQYSGTLFISREDLGQIAIYRDSFGIPHIKAKSFKATIFGLGVVHAQERLFSMYFKKLLATGRLSEFLGPKALPLDKFIRTLGVRRASEEASKHLDKETIANFQAYSDGINSFYRSLRVRPLEFILTGITFEDWTVEDCVSVGKLIASLLSEGISFSYLRQIVAENYGKELAKRIMATEEEFLFDKTYIVNDDELKEIGLFQKYSMIDNIVIEQGAENPVDSDVLFNDLVIDFAANVDVLGKGSNSWVVHGNHTKSGKPILANDPHLENQMPCAWMQTELIYGENYENFVIGMGYSGFPYILVGKNNHVAWGITNNWSDSSSFFRLEVKNDMYYYNNSYHPIKYVEENIKVKGGQDVPFKVGYTHHGPMMDVIFDKFEPFKKLAYNVSLTMTSLVNKETTFGGLYDMMKMSNSKEVVTALASVKNPALNIVFATDEGDIGYFATGLKPIKHQSPGNSFFRNGSDPLDDWAGYIPDDEDLYIINPKKGYIGAANNKYASNNLKHHHSFGMISTARSKRISDVLDDLISRGEKITVEQMKKMQFDVRDPYAEAGVKHLIKISENILKKFKDGKEKTSIQALLEVLKTWDFEMETQSQGALIFEVWEYHFQQRLLRKIKSSSVRHKAVSSFFIDHFIFRKLQEWGSGLPADGLDDSNEEWCTYNNTIPEEFKEFGCQYIATVSLLDAEAFLLRKLGPDRSRWVWGNLHKQFFKHIPFSETPLKYFYERKFPYKGNTRTINVAISNFRDGSFDSFASANTRLVMTFGDEEKSFYSIDTGVSESCFSSHYDDQMELERNEELIEMVYGFENLHKNRDVLLLLPQSS